MSAPRGYITRMLVLDCETTGLFFNADDPSFDSNTNQYHQALSWGMIVVNVDTMTAIEELYLEMKWDGKSQWNAQAQAIHGMSKEYLEQNGMDRVDAITAIGNLIIKHWGPSTPVHVCGHNPMFDLAFLKRDLRSQGLEVKFGNKMIDTNTIGLVVYHTHNSDDLFEMVGLPKRADHNALDDARNALTVVQTTRKIADKCFGGD